MHSKPNCSLHCMPGLRTCIVQGGMDTGRQAQQATNLEAAGQERTLDSRCDVLIFHRPAHGSKLQRRCHCCCNVGVLVRSYERRCRCQGPARGTLVATADENVFVNG